MKGSLNELVMPVENQGTVRKLVAKPTDQCLPGPDTVGFPRPLINTSLQRGG